MWHESDSPVVAVVRTRPAWFAGTSITAGQLELRQEFAEAMFARWPTLQQMYDAPDPDGSQTDDIFWTTFFEGVHAYVSGAMDERHPFALVFMPQVSESDSEGHDDDY